MKYIVFDLDGTLIDSRQDIVNSFNETLEKYGVEPVEEEIIGEYVGTGVGGLLKKVVDENNGRISEGQLIQRFREVYAQRLLDHTYLFEGVLETLDHFAAKQLFVLTNKSLEFARPILKGLGVEGHFVDVFGRESFAKMKPDPLPLHRLCQKYNLEASDGLMVGDTLVDMNAGRSAGLKVCAVTFGFGKTDGLREFEPEFMIDRFDDLIVALK